MFYDWQVTLQQALKDIMEGQSINRSSVKYNIPARTLRDWMKRLNIKSVFTHNHNSPGGGGATATTTSPTPSNEGETKPLTIPAAIIVGGGGGSLDSRHQSTESSDSGTSATSNISLPPNVQVTPYVPLLMNAVQYFIAQLAGS